MHILPKYISTHFFNNCCQNVSIAAVLKISGFSTWKDVEQIDEAQARYLINLEKDKIKTAETFGYDYIIYEFDKSDV